MLRAALVILFAFLFAFALVLTQDRKGDFEEVSLQGKADNGVYEVALTIKKVDKEMRLKCRWVDWYGFAYEVDTKLKDEVWKVLRPAILASVELKSADSDVSHANDWVVHLRVDDLDHKFAIRGEEHLEDKRYLNLIAAMLDSRDHCLAFAKRIAPKPAEPGRDLRRVGDGGSRQLLMPALARSRAAYITADSAECHGILLSGCFLNAEVVEALVTVLDRGKTTKAAAACAALAWISGRPASDDFKTWKDWWVSERGRWNPKVESPGIGAVGKGTVRALSGGLSGFQDIELDPDGDVWGSADQVYKLDGKTDAWKPGGTQAKVDASYEPENRLDFLRRMSKSGIAVELRHDGLAVSGNGKRGVAVMGTEANRFLTQVLGTFDFEKGTWKRAVEGSNSFGNPVLNHDGSIVAVAEGWGWAAPNGVALFETSTGKRMSNPGIPEAETLYPFGWAAGAFYFFREEKEADREGEIWKHAVAENKSERVLTMPKRSPYWVGVRTRICIDSKGTQILVRKGTGQGACILGLLELSTADFSPVSVDGVQIDHYQMSPDGRRVVFIRNGVPFEWSQKP